MRAKALTIPAAALLIALISSQEHASSERTTSALATQSTLIAQHDLPASIGQEAEREGVLVTLIAQSDEDDLQLNEAIVASTERTLRALRRTKLKLDVGEDTLFTDLLAAVSEASGVVVRGDSFVEGLEVQSASLKLSAWALLDSYCHELELNWQAYGDVVLVTELSEPTSRPAITISYDLQELMLAFASHDEVFQRKLLEALRAKLSSDEDEDEDDVDPSFEDEVNKPLRNLSQDDIDSIRVGVLDEMWEMLSQIVGDEGDSMSSSSDGDGHFLITMQPHSHVFLRDTLENFRRKIRSAKGSTESDDE